MVMAKAPTESIDLPSQEPMLAAVGRGIQAFASVETAIGFCFASMMEPGDRSNAIVILEAARHIETKMRIVNAIADRSLTDEKLRKRWASLKNKIKRRTDVRHKLAHWTVGLWPGARSAEDAKKWKIALVPPMISSAYFPVMWGKPGDSDEKPIFIDQLETFHAKCNELFGQLVAFSDAIKEAKRDGK